MNRIEVNGIRLYAYHGCLKEEGVIGGHYVVDVTIDTDFSVAAETCLLYTSPSPRDRTRSRMPSSA